MCVYTIAMKRPKKQAYHSARLCKLSGCGVWMHAMIRLDLNSPMVYPELQSGLKDPESI